MTRPAGTRNRWAGRAPPSTRRATSAAGERRAGARIARRPTGGELCPPRQFERLRRAEARVDESLRPRARRRRDRSGRRAGSGGRVRAAPRRPGPRPSRGRTSAGPRAGARAGPRRCARHPYPRCAAPAGRRSSARRRSFSRAVRALPRCSAPVGLGAKRVTCGRDCMAAHVTGSRRTARACWPACAPAPYHRSSPTTPRRHRCTGCAPRARCSSRTCTSTPAILRSLRQFHAFLETDARRADALYILGDLFEAWLGDDDPDPLARASRRGTARADRCRRALLRDARQPRLPDRRVASAVRPAPRCSRTAPSWTCTASACC